MKLNLLLIPIFLFLLASCSSNGGKSTNTNTIQTDNIIKPKEIVFPEKAQRLDSLKKTVFLPTFESNFHPQKNAIYSASLGMTWDEIKKQLQETITKIESEQLKQIDNSKGYLGTLKKGEYKTDVQLADEHIIAKTFFNKYLPFRFPLARETDSLKFLNQKVASFSTDSRDQLADIMYYNSDHDFALKLHPKDTTHKIILVKSDFTQNSSPKKLIQQLSNKINDFKQARNQNNSWKYKLKRGDRVRIPIMSFNLENNYANIEGTSFYTQNRKQRVTTWYQRVAFILNEKGAKVESADSVFTAYSGLSDDAYADMEKTKNLIFDKPFLILLKRADSENPYFVMFVANVELMEKPSTSK